MRMAGPMNKARPQSKRSSSMQRGMDARAIRGNTAKNKDHLGSDRDRTMSAKPAAKIDEFGSRHNRDQRTKAQRKNGREEGRSNLAFRESAQDLRKPRGRAAKREE